MSKALNATGHAVLFNLCEWGVNNPWQWAAPIAQSWRMAGDHEATWASTKSVIASSAAIPANYTGQAYAWNDMDMLETGVSQHLCATCVSAAAATQCRAPPRFPALLPFRAPARLPSATTSARTPTARRPT